MSAKKGRNQKGKDKKDSLLSRVDVKFYELTIEEIEKRIQRLRNQQDALAESNEAIAEQIRALNEDCKDPAGELSNQVKSAEKNLSYLNEELEELQRLYDDERKQGDETIQDLEAKFKAMHDQLTTEIKLYYAKITSLNEFRENIDKYLLRVLDQEEDVKAKELEYEESMKAMKEKAFIEGLNVKKDVECKLLEVAEDFMRRNETRNSNYTRRIIRENIALQKEIESLVSSNNKIAQQLKDESARYKEIRETFPALHQQKRELIMTVQKQQNVIQRLTVRYERIREKYVTSLRYCDEYEKLNEKVDCKRVKQQNIEHEARYLASEINKLQLERRELMPIYERNTERLRRLKQCTDSIRSIIARAINVISERNTQQAESRHDEAAPSDVDLLSKLKEILASEIFGDSTNASLSTIAYSNSLFNYSDMQDQSSATLFEIFRRDDAAALHESQYSDVSIALDGIDRVDMIYPVERDIDQATHIVDVLSGTTLYVSSSHRGVDPEMLRIEGDKEKSDSEASMDSSMESSALTQVSVSIAASPDATLEERKSDGDEKKAPAHSLIVDVELIGSGEGDEEEESASDVPQTFSAHGDTGLDEGEEEENFMNLFY